MAITSGDQLRPATTKNALASAYVDFTSTDTEGWAQQYLPDLMEKEAEVFGNRSVSGFLSQVGAEEAMQADKVVWTEQGRLHLSYGGATHGSTDGLINLLTDADGNSIDAAGEVQHSVRAGDTVLITSATATVRCYVTATEANYIAPASAVVAADHISVLPYNYATLNAVSGISTSTTVNALVYGSEYLKGQSGRTDSINPGFKSYTNKPIIIKDKYHVSGSDTTQIGWVEVSGEEGQNGYLWYLKAEGDTRRRFSDYLEMAMIESYEKTASPASTSPVEGTEGLFAAIEDRGHLATGITGVNAATDLAEFDSMLAKFDENGAIEENMMFVDRTTALAIDDMLASMNSYGAGGTSYGVFNNSEDMALNLGFSGFRRGSYDFYKSDWKYLNDKGTRGSAIDTVNAVRGVVIPAGTSSVYDENMGRNITRPFLHVRYRANATENRKYKTWTTGSVANITSDLDALEMHYLSERCLVVQGANNFMMLT